MDLNLVQTFKSRLGWIAIITAEQYFGLWQNACECMRARQPRPTSSTCRARETQHFQNHHFRHYVPIQFPNVSYFQRIMSSYPLQYYQQCKIAIHCYVWMKKHARVWLQRQGSPFISYKHWQCLWSHFLIAYFGIFNAWNNCAVCFSSVLCVFGLHPVN